MDNRKEFIELLSAAIRGKTLIIENENINLKEIFKEAQPHSVTGLIYSAIDKKSKFNKINEDIIDNVKKEVIFSAINQAQHIKRTAKVLAEFNKKNIPIIALKGLVVRDFYPKADLRTMSDADVLIQSDDLDKSRELLLSLGFVEREDSSNNGVHIVFDKNNLSVELHHKLVHGKLDNGHNSFENSLWKEKMLIKVDKVETLSLGLEDLLLHLCSHMAGDFAGNGFGVRQLCDVVVLVEKKGEEINWIKFLDKARKANLDKFSLVIFKACNMLFNMEIPKGLEKANNLDEKYINLFINEVFNSGNHGVKEKVGSLGNRIALKLGNSNDITQRNLGKASSMLSVIVNMTKSKYNYANKYKILVPIACIHYWIDECKRSKYNVKELIKTIISTIPRANKKSHLIQWLDIYKVNI